MKILDIKDYKKLTDEQIKNLIEETKKNIEKLKRQIEELYAKKYNRSNETEFRMQAIDRLSEYSPYMIEFEIEEKNADIELYARQLNNLIIFRTAREEYSYYCEKDVYKNYKCDECGRVNDLTLSEKSGDILEFRGYCYCCHSEQFKVIKKNPF